MINSTTSSGRTAHTEPSVTLAAKAAVRGPGSDRFSPQQSATLKAALEAQPEVRPEVVARGKELAADPNYPSMDIIRGIAGQILRSPDLANDNS